MKKGHLIGIDLIVRPAAFSLLHTAVQILSTALDQRSVDTRCMVCGGAVWWCVAGASTNTHTHKEGLPTHECTVSILKKSFRVYGKKRGCM
jgi:hypothetical protein